MIIQISDIHQRVGDRRDNEDYYQRDHHRQAQVNQSHSQAAGQMEAGLQPQNNGPNDHSNERGPDEHWDHQVAQVQDKDPQEYEDQLQPDIS